MKTLSLKVDLSTLNISDEDKQKNGAEVATNIIKNVIYSYATQNKGFTEDERRIYYKICDAFDVVIKDKKEEVILDDSYIVFIKKVFKETRLIPNDLLRKIEELIAIV
jgi:hypothetical protein